MARERNSAIRLIVGGVIVIGVVASLWLALADRPRPDHRPDGAGQEETSDADDAPDEKAIEDAMREYRRKMKEGSEDTFPKDAPSGGVKHGNRKPG